MLKWLKGKKTYVCMIGLFVAGGLSAVGVPIPPPVWALLGGCTAGALRAGMKKAEKAAKKPARYPSI